MFAIIDGFSVVRAYLRLDNYRYLDIYYLYNDSLRIDMQTVEQQKITTQDQLFTPLVTILDEVTPKTSHVYQSNTPKSSISLKDSLESLFPEQQYDEKNIQSAKKILGSVAENFTTEEVRDIVTEVQYLTNNCLDDFERMIFEGITLKELLHEKNSL